MAASLLFMVPATGQATLVVGPGSYPQITDAIAAANPGDLILVQPGSYLPFNVSIGVRVLAPNGATVTTPPGGGGLPWLHQIQAPAGQQTEITGLTFRTNSAYPPAEPPVAVRATGQVRFADCQFYNWADYPSSSVYCNGDVRFDRCTWDGVYQSLTIQGGRAALSHCQLRTLQMLSVPLSASCIGASNCELAIHASTLRGAHGTLGSSAPTGAPAIQIGTATRMTLADCAVYGGNSYSGAVSAIVSTSAFPILHARSVVLSGTPGFSGGPPVPAPNFSGLEQSAPLPGALAPIRPTIGATGSGTVIGQTNHLTLLALTFALTPAASVSFAAQPIHFDPAASAIYDIGILNGASSWTGFGTYAWQTPALPPGVFGLQFWLHPLVWDGATFQVGPSFGGTAY